jgi:hypothetical protein
MLLLGRRDFVLLPTLHAVRLGHPGGRSRSARVQNCCNWLVMAARSEAWAERVVVDHAAKMGSPARQSDAARHEISSDEVENELLDGGFEILKRDDHFIDRTGQDHIWWLITARKP